MDQLLSQPVGEQSHDFRHIIDEYGDFVMTICKRILVDENLAEEATQDVFLKVYRNLDKFRRESGMKTWVYRIAYHTAIDYSRKTKKNVVSFEAIPENLQPVVQKDAQEVLEENEQTKWINEAIARLPADQSALTILYYMEGKNIKEVSQITGLSESNVKIKLFRARKLLAEILSKSKNSFDHGTER